MADLNVKAPDKEEIVRQEEELEKKNKWLYPAVIIVLTLFFIVGFAYGLQSVLSMEGAFPPVELTDSRTPVPETNEELVAYLRTAYEKTLAEKPSASTDWIFRLEEDEIVLSPESDATLDTLRYLSGPAEDYLEDCVEPMSADFSEDLSGLLRAPAFDASDVSSFSCTYIFYKCSSCGEESAEPLENCELCGSEYPYQMQYRENYSFDVELRADDELASGLFKPDGQEIVALADPAVSDYFKISDLQTSLKSLTVHFETNRTTDELQTLRFAKSADVTFTLTDPDGAATVVSVPVSTRSDYNMIWPALKLNTHSLVLEPKGSGNLLADRICSDPVSYTASWESSDEGIVSVDEEGYLKAGKEPGDATVTASFTFNGKTYSDSCEISVRVPVESMRLNKRRLVLTEGETAKLAAKVSPKDATVRTASFFTTDESVAVVSQDGTVTAVGQGTATVYGLSDDGYYKSSCEVSVK